VNTTLFDYVGNASLVGIASNTTESSETVTTASSGVATSNVANPTANLGSSYTSSSPAATTTDASGKVSPAVPIGVGVALGAALTLTSCALGGLLIRERRRRIQAEQYFTGADGYRRMDANEKPPLKPPTPVELMPGTPAPELDSHPVYGPANLPKPTGYQHMRL